MQSEYELTNAFAELLLAKGVRLKLQRPGKEMGIKGTQEEIYLMDRPVALTAEEVQTFLPMLVDKRAGQRTIDRDIRLVNWIAFVVQPEEFTESDPNRPKSGEFVNISK